MSRRPLRPLVLTLLVLGLLATAGVAVSAGLDFAQAIQAHWPDTPTASKTFTVPLAADQKDSSDIAITIGFVSSGVTYHYRK